MATEICKLTLWKGEIQELLEQLLWDLCKINIFFEISFHRTCILENFIFFFIFNVLCDMDST